MNNDVQIDLNDIIIEMRARVSQDAEIIATLQALNKKLASRVKQLEEINNDLQKKIKK